MEKLDTLLAEHIERRLLAASRLEEVLSGVLYRRGEQAERRADHSAALKKRAAEADAKLKRLYDAIEAGVADLTDPMRRVGLVFVSEALINMLWTSANAGLAATLRARPRSIEARG